MAAQIARDVFPRTARIPSKEFGGLANYERTFID
jgi:hypothetical protein